jgi:hypothetical protein
MKTLDAIDFVGRASLLVTDRFDRNSPQDLTGVRTSALFSMRRVSAVNLGPGNAAGSGPQINN